MPENAVVGGDFIWGEHLELGCEPRYAVVLRDPIARAVSYYRWAQRMIAQMRRVAGDVAGEAVVDAAFRGLGSLREAADQPLSSLIGMQVLGGETNLVNGMTAALAGRKPSGLHDEETLAVAISNLDACAWVGVLELGFDLVTLSTLIGAPIAGLGHLNRGDQNWRPGWAGLHSLVEANRLDLELYAHARRLMKRRGRGLS